MFFGRSPEVPACLGDDLRCSSGKIPEQEGSSLLDHLPAPLPWEEAAEKATGKGELGDKNVPSASLSRSPSAGALGFANCSQGL